MQAPLYLVDFDGVICDSRFECMVTSHVAHRRLFSARNMPFDASVIAPDAAEQFIHYRYLARTAREFALLWDLIDTRTEINDEQWIRTRAHADEARLLQFHDAFYATRYQWMEMDMAGWLKIHQLYPGLKNNLVKWLAQDRAHIVSSKDSRSILALLRHHDIDLPESLVGGCEGGDKNEHFRRLRETAGRDMAFIDDNLENLITARENGITGYLASWGYTSADIVDAARLEGFSILTLPTVEQLI